MKAYKVKVSYTFEGWYRVAAENEERAREIARRDCGLVMGAGIHTSNPMHVEEWEFGVHPETAILASGQIE